MFLKANDIKSLLKILKRLDKQMTSDLNVDMCVPTVYKF